MSKYIGPINRIARRLNFSILENNKEFSKGKRRTTKPGIHAREVREDSLSPYAKALAETQKLKFLYFIREKYLRNMIRNISSQGSINLTNRLIEKLESRFDNILFRAGIKTRQSARQLIAHKHFTLNGKEVDIASIIIKNGDIIQAKETSKEKDFFSSVWNNSKSIPSYINIDKENFIIKIISNVTVPENLGINTSLIIEKYKK